MPCSLGMRKCRTDCAHRTFVGDYRIARHAQVLEEERLTIGDPWMIKERRAQGIRPITFKKWLEGSARA
jgi:hypothetical protein